MSLSTENNDTKIGPEEEIILSFIAQKKQVRWTDLTKEFEENRKWHHSKFVKHWKIIKQYLDKVPNKKTGRDEYKIGCESQKLVDKALLRTQTSDGDLNTVEIAVEKKVFLDLVKIQILTSPGETVPLLTEEDIDKLVDVVLPKFFHENSEKPREKPFKIIISYPLKNN